VLFGDPSLVVAQLSFGAHGTIDLHAAPYPIEVVALSGAGFVQVGNERCPFVAGQRIQWPAGVEHRLWTEGEPLVTLMLERRGLREHTAVADPEGEPIDMHTFGPGQNCFGCSPANEIGMRLRFFVRGRDVLTRFRARPGWGGPPGILHGGLAAVLADELGTWTLVGLRNAFGFTSGMSLRYYRPARLDEEIEGRGRIASETDSQTVVSVVLKQGGKRVLSGTVTLTRPTLAMAEDILGVEIPESWRSMVRDA
jgi:acyl-coenzyme A thioesterase PaaI-like protein